MKKRVLKAASILALFSSQAFAMSDDDCAAAWKAADKDANGVVTMNEAPTWYTSLSVSGKPVIDGQLDQGLYIENCKAGLFKTDVARTTDNTSPNSKSNQTAAPSAGAASNAPSDVPPLKGANSFTEQQAKDRIEKSGFKQVSALKKDDDGIWRGTVSDGAKSVSVAVDFKGNVVTK